MGRKSEAILPCLFFAPDLSWSNVSALVRRTSKMKGAGQLGSPAESNGIDHQSRKHDLWRNRWKKWVYTPRERRCRGGSKNVVPLLRYVKFAAKRKVINCSVCPLGIEKKKANGFKRQQRRFKEDIRTGFPAVTVVKYWNRLPGEVVGSSLLAVFKNRLDKHLSGMIWV